MDFIYTYNNQSQAVAADGIVTTPTIARRYGSVDEFNGSVSLGASGWYKVTATVTFTSTAGQAGIGLYQDGLQVLGAESTLTAEASTTYTLVIDAIVRKQTCRCDKDILTIVNTGATTLTITNATMTATRL